MGLGGWQTENKCVHVVCEKNYVGVNVCRVCDSVSLCFVWGVYKTVITFKWEHTLVQKIKRHQHGLTITSNCGCTSTNMNVPLAVTVHDCWLWPGIHKYVKYICLCVQLALFVLYSVKRGENTIQFLSKFLFSCDVTHYLNVFKTSSVPPWDLGV